jgi:hypothetical protein
VFYEPSPTAVKIQRDDLTPRQFVDALVEAGQYSDAVDFLAHALPKREAVWWACLGVRHALGFGLRAEERAALSAAVAWVLEPDEPNRRTAEAAGELADFGSAAGCVALAVYASGGSLTASNLPEVPPDAFMTAKAVAASLALASVQGDPTAIPALQRELVDLGLSIAEGKTVCPPVLQSAAPVHDPAGGRTRHR